MSGKRLGPLAPDDPLHAFLAGEVLGRVLGVPVNGAVFDVFGLDERRAVYRYVERGTGADLVGKFFGRKGSQALIPGPPVDHAQQMLKEYESLRILRARGLDACPHQVVRPLAVSKEIGCVLVEEYVPGGDLDGSIREAVAGSGGALLERLEEVGAFLADLHGRTRLPGSAPADEGPAYLEQVAGQLELMGLLPPGGRERLERLEERWAAGGVLGGCRRVLVHGDATPPHFRRCSERGVTAIDLERMRPGDPAVDVGCMAAELHHLFGWYGADPAASEPFIRALYAAYTGALSVGEEDFAAFTERGRYFMGCYQLRIARNHWISDAHRGHLIDHAQACLRL